MTLKEKESFIINHYGVLPQLKYFYSEIFELTEAIINQQWLESEFHKEAINEGREHIAEEIADVQMMLNQFKEFYSVSDIVIDSTMNLKANRQIERIKNNE